MVHDLEPAKIFDVNGTTYRVGLDDYNYVQIQVGEVHEDEFFARESDKDLSYAMMFDPTSAEEVIAYIEELLNNHID